MGEKIPATLLNQIYDALCDKNRRTDLRLGKSLPVADTIIARGWIYSIELEELLLETDSRVTHLDLVGLSEYLELPWRAVFLRPRYLSAGAFGTNALSLADAACFLIRMEEMGFDSVPERLVQHGLRQQRDLTHVTESEWTLLSYAKRRYKEQFNTRSDFRDDDGEWHPCNWKDTQGRRIEFTLIGARPHLMTVTGPKYRALKPRVRTTCEECGFSYTKGDPESANSHRSEHARVMRFLAPRPLVPFTSRLQTHADPERVTVESPIWMHREVHQRARQFKHELQFDFCQWEGSQKTKNMRAESHGYLFADHTAQYGTGAAVGACAFWRDKDQWRLRWVWVCPGMRRAGVLARRWKQFLARYGDFEIEVPLSASMQAFVMKHGTQVQKAQLQIS